MNEQAFMSAITQRSKRDGTSQIKTLFDVASQLENPFLLGEILYYCSEYCNSHQKLAGTIAIAGGILEKAY